MVNYSYNQKVRRQRVKKLIVRGMCVSKIAERLDVTRKTIYKDIDAIKEEINDKLESEPIQEILFDTEAQLESIKDEYWKKYHNSDNESIQMGALNQLMHLTKDRIRVLQRLGIIREEPEKLEGDLNIDITEEIIPSHSDEEE